MSKQFSNQDRKNLLGVLLISYGNERERLIKAIERYHRALHEAAMYASQNTKEDPTLGDLSLHDLILYRLNRIEQDTIEVAPMRWLEESFRLTSEQVQEIVEEVEEKRRQDRLTYLATMPYKEYLLTPEWQARRLRILERDGYRCQLCNATNTTFNVHHKTYARRGNEDDTDLITLCQDCHSIFHENSRLAE